MEEGQGRIVEAIRQLQERVQWKPGKEIQHLAKRIALGHLPVGTTQAEYDALILRVVRTSTAAVFTYRWGDSPYSTVLTEVNGVQWLVMLSLDGVMETAFPPDDPETYLATPPFPKLGILEELGL